MEEKNSIYEEELECEKVYDNSNGIVSFDCEYNCEKFCGTSPLTLYFGAIGGFLFSILIIGYGFTQLYSESIIEKLIFFLIIGLPIFAILVVPFAFLLIYYLKLKKKYADVKYFKEIKICKKRKMIIFYDENFEQTRLPIENIKKIKVLDNTKICFERINGNEAIVKILLNSGKSIEFSIGCIIEFLFQLEKYFKLKCIERQSYFFIPTK